MVSSIVLKLRQGAQLTAGDEAALAILATTTRRTKRADDLPMIQQRLGDMVVISEGMACRYRQLQDGSRSITSILLAGDICRLDKPLVSSSDHGLSCIADCNVAYISSAQLELLTSESPRIEQALTWAKRVEEATLREWITNISCRSATHRLCHLFCELNARLNAISRGQNGMSFPMTQVQMSQATGMSLVHVNRVLKNLREEGLASHRSGSVNIDNIGGLIALCGFEVSYLQ